MRTVNSALDETFRRRKIRNCVKTALLFIHYVQTTLLRQGMCIYSFLCIVFYAYIVLFV